MWFRKNELVVRGETNNWQELLKICKSENVVFRGMIRGHKAYSATWSDDWCVLYYD